MKISKPLVIIFLVLAAVGFLDATYLTVEHYLGVIPPCVIAGGCSVVLTSEWSVVYGIPIALLGSVYYLSLLILAVIYLKTRSTSENNGSETLIVTASFTTIIGFLTSIFLVGLQLFVIKDICFYCIISAISSIALFVVGTLILLNYRRKIQTENHERLGRSTASEIM